MTSNDLGLSRDGGYPDIRHFCIGEMWICGTLFLKSKVGELEIDLLELSGASVFFSFRRLVAYILGISKLGRGFESFMPMLTYHVAQTRFAFI